jgi:hypothetical protein
MRFPEVLLVIGNSPAYDTVPGMRRTWISVGSLLFLVPMTLLAQSGVFPDVLDTYPHKQAIERLVGMGIINGNPDGTFAPDRTVNRAEMLTMLFRAARRQSQIPSKRCFGDVEPGAWYEAVVCDAAAARFVGGYSDGTFRPARAVSRVEALKMTMEVLQIPVPELTQQSRQIVKFTDVSVGAWYTKYLYEAFAQAILPIPGQDGPRFSPDQALTRGEAAAYISAALFRKAAQQESMSSASAVAPAVQEAASSSSRVAAVQAKELGFPFNDADSFDGKKALLYRFSLAESTVLGITTEGVGGGVSCRLYKLEGDGLSYEYYLGYEDDDDCTMRVAVGVGNYQLEVLPAVADTSVSVEAFKTTGDGNDGFKDAKELKIGSQRVGSVEVEDFGDWYTFTVTKESTLTLSVFSERVLQCLITPLRDVELFSFSGPTCNDAYVYPAGTYVVSVGHAKNRAAERYTIGIK